MLTKVLERCIGAANSDVKQFSGNINLAKYEFSLLSLSIPVFQCISLISDGRASLQHPGVHDWSENSMLSLYMAPSFLNTCLDIHSYNKIYFMLFPGTFLIVLQLKNVPHSGYIS